MCNAYLEENYREALQATVANVNSVKDILENNGWKVMESEPLKIVIKSPKVATGEGIANMLRRKQIECEYADKEYVVFMVTPENSYEDLQNLAEALGENHLGVPGDYIFKPIIGKQEMSVRCAMFSKQKKIAIEDARLEVCASPMVGCPPAIPIVVSGEVITDEAISLFRYYGIKEVFVVI